MGSCPDLALASALRSHCAERTPPITAVASDAPMLRSSRVYRALAIVGSAFFAACSKDSSTDIRHVGPPASLTIVGGDQQQGTVGAELPQPVDVKVVDANGNAIQGQLVN